MGTVKERLTGTRDEARCLSRGRCIYHLCGGEHHLRGGAHLSDIAVPGTRSSPGRKGMEGVREQCRLPRRLLRLLVQIFSPSSVLRPQHRFTKRPTA